MEMRLYKWAKHTVKGIEIKIIPRMGYKFAFNSH